MLSEDPQCPKCRTSLQVEVCALFRAIGTDRIGRLRQPGGIICPICGVKLRIDQPRIVRINVLVLGCFGGAAALAGAIARHNGIAARGASGLIVGSLFIAMFELLRRWYTPRLARPTIVDTDHPLYFPLGYGKSANAMPLSTPETASNQRWERP
jgi:hypothetical protein